MVLDSMESYKLNDFCMDKLEKRKFREWEENNSHFRLGSNVNESLLNYCGNLTTQRSNLQGEMVKEKVFQNWIKDFELEEMNYIPVQFENINGVSNVASKHIKKLNFVQKLKAFRKKIKAEGK